MKEPIRGKAEMQSLLFELSRSAPCNGRGRRCVDIHSRDANSERATDETHSRWTLELVGATGKVCTVNWRTFRKWKDSRVVLEHHYEHQQSGEPLSDGDLQVSIRLSRS